MRGALRGRAFSLAIGIIAGFTSFMAYAQDQLAVTATPITRFKSVALNERVDAVVFRGGLIVTSDDKRFGSFSSISFVDLARFIIVSDRGAFISGRMDYRDGVLSGLSDVEIDVIRNSAGAPLPRKFAQDAESLDIIIKDGVATTARVGFENLTRVADFKIIDGRAGGAALPVSIPEWLEKTRDNRTLESLCIAPLSSGVAGSTLLITEGHVRIAGTWAGAILGARDKGEISLKQASGFNPTDCAFLPNGDALILERGISLFGFTMQVRRIPAEMIVANAVIDGPVILRGQGMDVDNMEGIAVRQLPDNDIRITIVSDDNSNSFQRSMVLEFSLIEDGNL